MAEMLEFIIGEDSFLKFLLKEQPSVVNERRNPQEILEILEFGDGVGVLPGTWGQALPGLAIARSLPAWRLAGRYTAPKGFLEFLRIGGPPADLPSCIPSTRPPTHGGRVFLYTRSSVP